MPRGAGLTGSLADLRPGDVLETCTVLTTAANAVVAPVHHRMPAILDPAAIGAWLAGGDVPLGPFPPEAMTSVRVSPLVNDPRNDDPRCIAPVASEPEPELWDYGA